ncbi:phosphoenolpyruvate synthase/pyruvate phosphate dikinase [Moorella thermoacetica Y72]|uniref:Phosphoenolpyruvate synthase n=1 Tax=Moorella thermoacetica Y72 TaxID=1325331 RepID=A0A0S6UAR7_NEOTH|nr:PEP/pyruvate-binding domain-containing protein [Moorella thermoacetica]GAF25000.1 phosphoenolpyruvate synthase/pyruvate phosphate dikinase [Moorella thermoacetica Y72]
MWITWFGELEHAVASELGGKGASLSHMTSQQIPVPPGFTIKASAFRYFMDKANLRPVVIKKLASVRTTQQEELNKASLEIQNLIKATPLPAEIREDIVNAYHQMMANGGQVVAVRSSATMEDSEAASCAGQHETYLFITGEEQLLTKVKECWASMYNPRAIVYRLAKGVAEEEAAIAVVVQKMVTSEKSGVMFTVNPVNKNRDELIIEAVWGQGEGIVSGLITPDNYILNRSERKVISEYIATKEIMLVAGEEPGKVCEVQVPSEKVTARVLTKSELQALVKLGEQVERYFGVPQDIEWAIEGDNIYLLQSRPITTI